jgi:tetratricopeptide (TPR) repeat protein
MSSIRRRPAVLALLSVLAVVPPVAQARAEAGLTLENVELRTLAGGKERLLSTQAKANVFVFFRTGQERSVDALKQMASCEMDFAGKPVHWVAIVSGSAAPADVQAVVQKTGIQMPVLIDEADALYDRLGVRLHPMVGLADGRLRLVAMEPYRQLEFCDVIKTRIRVLLGEATMADLDQVRNPEKSPLPGEDRARKALRDVNLARRLYEIGQHEKAVKQAQHALEIAPVAQAFVVMGEAYAKLGRCADSTKALDEAQRLEPGNQDVAAARALCPGK